MSALALKSLALPRIASLDLRAPIEVKEGSSVITPSGWTGAANSYGMMLYAAEITPRMAWLLYETVGTLAKVVDLIADNVAMLDPLVLLDGKPAPNPDPVLKFLGKPGLNRDRIQLIREITIQHLLTGTAYLASYGNIKYEPEVLDVLKSMYVQPMHFGSYPEAYVYSEASQLMKRFDKLGGRDYRWIDSNGLAELTPIYAMDGQRRGIGRSRLAAIQRDVELRLKGTEHNTSVMDKGARPSALVNFRSGLTFEQAKDVGAQVNRDLGGTNNAGKVIVTGGGDMQFEQLSMTPKDMDWSNLQKITDDAITARFNVPPTLFNSDAQTDNNYETAWNMFYDNAVLPEFKTIWGGIARCLSYRLGMDISFKHDATTNNILFRQISARVRDLKGANIVTTNEARQELGKEPLAGGDYIYGTGFEQPLEQDVYDELRDMPTIAPPVSRDQAEANAQIGKTPEGPRGESRDKAPKRDSKSVWFT